MAYHIMFPPEMLALQNELKNHPDILKKLENTDLADSFGVIAAELGILLDGMYDPVDLANMLTEKLKQRGSLILIQDPRLLDVQIKEGPKTLTIERAQLLSPKSESK